MGEESKFIGEHGEEIVGRFLNRIGWTHRSPNFDVPCVYGDNHKGENGNNRKSHGLDFVFCYESPLFNRQLDSIIGSVKYSSKAYPKSPGSKFKTYANELSDTIECFRRSERLYEMKRGFSGVDHTETRGLLFWLSGESDTEDILASISNLRTGAIASPIALVDNFRFAFLWKCLDFVERATLNSLASWNFAYHSTGHNQEGKNLAGEGKLLPFELLTGGPIVFRINEVQSKTMAICCPERFSADALRSLLDLAMEHSGRGWASQVQICFANYETLNHRGIAADTLASFPDKVFARGVRVKCLDSLPLP